MDTLCTICEAPASWRRNPEIGDEPLDLAEEMKYSPDIDPMMLVQLCCPDGTRPYLMQDARFCSECVGLIMDGLGDDYVDVNTQLRADYLEKFMAVDAAEKLDEILSRHLHMALSMPAFIRL